MCKTEWGPPRLVLEDSFLCGRKIGIPSAIAVSYSRAFHAEMKEQK